MSKDPLDTQHRHGTRHAGLYYRYRSDGSRLYCFTYRDAGGKQHWTSRWPDGRWFRGERDALACQGEYRARCARGQRVVVSNARFAAYARHWLEEQSRLRQRTRDAYRWAIETHLVPRFGGLKLSAITEDDIAALIHDMEKQGYSGWTIRAALTPLRRILGHAARKDLIARNPFAGLERDERPRVEKKPKRIVTPSEWTALRAVCVDIYKVLFAVAYFTGLRQSELLGLVWSDIDFEKGVIRVTGQLDRKPKRRVLIPKTHHGFREVALMPALAKKLKEHRLRAPQGLSAGNDFVFLSVRTGGPLDHRSTAQALERAMKRAKLNDAHKPKLTFHSLRHTWGSIRVSEGEDVVFLSQQMGHSSPKITMEIYAHEYNARGKTEALRNRMETTYGALV
jgi:integrase